MRRNQQFVNLDADESIFFARQLEYVKTQTYDILYPEFKARKILPVSFEAGPGADTIKYESFDKIGVAKIVANYADDLPRADIRGTEVRSPVRSIADSYGYNIQEIRAAKMAGKPLTQRKADAAKKACVIKEHNVAMLGDADTGLGGFLNNPNMTQYTVPNDGSGSTITWSTKTPTQIVRDMNGMISTIMTTTKGVESPDTLLLPIANWIIASTTQMPNIPMTVLTFFLENNPSITGVDWLNDLVGIGSGATNRMMAYRRDPSKLTLEVPQDFEQFPVQERGLEFVVPCHQRCGGVIIYYPLSIAYGDGI